MIIKGFQKVSLIDYPGKVAAVVFVAGCNFRCPYCYNRDLVLNPDSLPTFLEEEIFTYLQKRRGVLDGIVITGGEPTLQPDLLEFVKRVKSLELLVKLDTNGSKITILQSMVKSGLVDYVALDVKAPLDGRYARSVGVGEFGVSFILSSMKELATSNIDYEFRTTIVPTLHSEGSLLGLAEQIAEIAPKAKWYLQNFQPKNCLEPEFESIKPYSREELGALLVEVQKSVPHAQLRA